MFTFWSYQNLCHQNIVFLFSTYHTLRSYTEEFKTCISRNTLLFVCFLINLLVCCVFVLHVLMMYCIYVLLVSLQKRVNSDYFYLKNVVVCEFYSECSYVAHNFWYYCDSILKIFARGSVTENAITLNLQKLKITEEKEEVTSDFRLIFHFCSCIKTTECNI